MSEIFPQPGLHSENQADLRLQLDSQQNLYVKPLLKINHSPEQLSKLRKSFQASLNKLSNSNTRDIAVRELHQIIDQNKSSESLKIYLNSLGEVKKTQTSSAREQEVLLLSYIAQVFGEKIIEKGSGKNVVKMLEIIRSFYGDLNRSVHEAASISFCDLYKCTMARVDSEIVLRIFFDPLEIDMTSGVNVKSQQAASLCIFKWVQVLVTEDKSALISACYPRILLLYTRLRSDFPDLISALGVIADYQGLDQIVSDLSSLIRKTTQYLSTPGTGSNLYKIEACKFFACLAKNLRTVNYEIFEGYIPEVIAVLEQIKNDKLQNVQNAAKQALHEWKLLENILNELELKRVYETSSSDDVVKFNRINQVSSVKGPSSYKTVREIANFKQNSEKWGISNPKFLEKGTGNYFLSPKQSLEGLKNNKNDLQPYSTVPIKIDRTEAEELMHKKSAEYKNYYDSYTFQEPYKKNFTKKNLNKNCISIDKNIVKQSFKNLESQIEKNFKDMSSRLLKVDSKMDSTYDRLDDLNTKTTPMFFQRTKEKRSIFTQTAENNKISSDNKNYIVKKSIEKTDALSQAWLETLQWVIEENYEEAYKRILVTEDDIYLLRLMHKTGVCIQKLSQNTLKTVLQRLGMIINSNFLEELGLNWVSAATKSNFFNDFSDEDKQFILESVQKCTLLPGVEREIATNILKEIS